MKMMLAMGSALLGAALLSQPPLRAASGDFASPQEKVVAGARPFPLADVRLLDGPFRENMLRNQAYLRRLDADRLLHTFRRNAGLPSDAQPYGGWEDPKGELRGHSLGHYLTACALAYAALGDLELKSRGDYIVATLAKCQAASPSQGFREGYLSAFPESFIDRVDARQPVWAPYYTLHKIMAGLLDMHQLCGNAQALDVLKRQAAWVKFRMDRLSPEQRERMLGMEFGGMNEVLANLYAVTGDPEHLRTARMFDHRQVFDPLAAGLDRLNGLHANTQIPKMIGAAREYELTAEPAYREIAQRFWQHVAQERSYVIGGHSDREHFFPTNEFARHLSADTCETCNTYNMLKLTRHLFAWEPSVPLMDFYERALYNHILASQDPQQGMFVYLMSLKPGHFKTYSRPEDSFWCCVGTGMENHSQYGDSIYFHRADSLYVNLFIASELDWKAQGVKVRQETRFPLEGGTVLRLQCAKPAPFTLRLRCPAWADGMTVKVNGRAEKGPFPAGAYAAIQRTWKSGDKVEVSFPLRLRTEPLPGSANCVAFLYGPIVLAGELGAHPEVNPYARNQTELNNRPAPEVPVLIAEPGDDLTAKLRPVTGKPLHFTSRGLAQPELALAPFWQVHHQRYSVYWQRYSAGQWQQVREQKMAADAQRRTQDRRTVDAVQPGIPQSETDHRLASQSSRTGDFNSRKWRDAAEGGWFSYEVKVEGGQPMTLLCTYWGGDGGAREFDLLVDGEKIAAQKLQQNRPGEFFDATYPVPEALTKGKAKVTVKIQAQPGKMAGGLFGLRMLRP